MHKFIYCSLVNKTKNLIIKYQFKMSSGFSHSALWQKFLSLEKHVAELEDRNRKNETQFKQLERQLRKSQNKENSRSKVKVKVKVKVKKPNLKKLNEKLDEIVHLSGGSSNPDWGVNLRAQLLDIISKIKNKIQNEENQA